MSDPRFLATIPATWPFLRVCWLRYATPSYNGRVLMGSDVAYLFGEPPPARPGRHLIPGEAIARNNAQKYWDTHRRLESTSTVDYEALPHRAPRRFEHVCWLVDRFSESRVIDPFCGTGTTLHACKELGRQAIGIEIEERYCEIAVNRLRQGVLDLSA